MLDYEIKEYRVYWRKEFIGKITWRSRAFYTEEEAIDFVKEFRSGWISYRVEQIRNAIIDF